MIARKELKLSAPSVCTKVQRTFNAIARVTEARSGFRIAQYLTAMKNV
jgi:hypothetical protein